MRIVLLRHARNGYRGDWACEMLVDGDSRLVIVPAAAIDTMRDEVLAAAVRQIIVNIEYEKTSGEKA